MQCSILIGALLAPVTPRKCLWGNALLPDEEINQFLHRLHFLVRNKPIVLCDSHKVNKAHVEDVVFVDVPKRIQPMCVV